MKHQPASSLEEKQRWQAADHMECTYPAMDQQDEIYTYSQNHQRKGRSYPWFLEWHCNTTTWSLPLSLCPHLITMVSCSFAYTNLLVLTWWCYVAALYYLLLLLTTYLSCCCFVLCASLLAIFIPCALLLLTISVSPPINLLLLVILLLVIIVVSHALLLTFQSVLFYLTFLFF